jgi:hypothetical protein
MRRALLLAAALAAFAAPALAQQAAPAGFNPSVAYLTAWDGSPFQLLTTDANGFAILDQAATAAALAAYVAAHPAPAPTVAATPTPPPVTVTRYQLLLLFTPTERAAFLAAHAQAAALQPSDYQSVATGSPTPTATQQALVGLAAFDYVLDNMGPSDTISMADPETIQAMNLLVTLGVITQAREAVVLTGVRPS